VAGTFWHWSNVVDRLADPAYGGDPADAFDVLADVWPPVH
jgi:hypothetical protein